MENPWRFESGSEPHVGKHEGMEFHSQDRFEWATAFCFALAVVFAIAGIVSGVFGYMLFASLPFFFGICFFVTRAEKFEAVLDDESLVVTEPAFETIPMKHVQSLTINGKQLAADGEDSTGSICINHLTGTVRIPKHVNVPSSSIYKAILSRVPKSGADPRHDVLASIANEARNDFGDDRVWCYAARARLGRRVASGRAVGMGLALLATGATWALAPVVVPELGEPWIFVGIVLGLVGAIWWFVARRMQSPFPSHARGWKNAGLVITPKEIGVIQGDLKGRLRWDEITNIQLGGKVKSFQLTSGAERYSVVVSVEGAVFSFGDIYDRPLPIIYERLRSYWRPG